MRRDRHLARLGDLLARTALASWQHPLAVLVVAALACAATSVSLLGMRFRSDVADLAPHEMTQALASIEEDFGVLDQLIVLVRSEGPGPVQHLERFAAALEEELAGDELVRSVESGWGGIEESIRDGGLLRCAPAFTVEEDLDELERLLSPEGIASAVKQQAALLDLPGFETAAWVERDPLGLRNLLIRRLAARTSGERFHEGSRHWIAADGRALLVRVVGTMRAAEIDSVQVFLARMEEAVEAAGRRAFEEDTSSGEFSVSFGGGYALAAESESVLREDLERNITLSIALILGILWLAWRRIGQVFLAAVPLAVGIFVGFGLFSIFQREIIVLAMVSGAVLAALGIDFLIHWFERLRGLDGKAIDGEAITQATRAVGPSLCTAAITTALAFLSFVFVSGGFLRDLGLLTACGILTCLAATVTLAPALLRLVGGRDVGRRARRVRGPSSLGRGCAGLARQAIAYRAVTLAGAALLCLGAIAVLVLRPPGTRSDLMDLHPAGSQARRVERELRREFGGVVDPVLLRVEVAGGRVQALLDEVERVEGELVKLRAAGHIAGWASPLSFLPSSRSVRRVADLVAAADLPLLIDALRRSLAAEGFAVESFEPAIDVFRRSLEELRPPTLAELRDSGLAARIDSLVRAGPERSVALVAVHPEVAGDAASGRENLSRRLDEALRRAGVSAEVTGLHAVSAASSKFVVRHFLQASGLALGVIVAVVVLLLRRPRPILAALAPVACGTCWTLALQNLLGHDLNFMNVGVLPMVLGIGVDDGIHLVVSTLTSERGDPVEAARHTGPAVVWTSWTTLAAFGTLAFSTSPGLASVGLLCTLGIGSCLLASLLVLPALLGSGADASSSVRKDVFSDRG